MMKIPTLGIMGWVKLAGAALFVIAVGLLVWQGNAIYRDAKRLPIVEAENDELRAQLTIKDQQYAESQEASRGYQNELADLRIAATRERVPVVRLCAPARVPERRAVPVGGPGPDAAAAAARDVPPRAPLPGGGGDIGPELFALADRADELSAQVRGLQEYAAACSGAVQNGSVDSGILR